MKSHISVAFATLHRKVVMADKVVGVVQQVVQVVVIHEVKS